MLSYYLQVVLSLCLKHSTSSVIQKLKIKALHWVIFYFFIINPVTVYSYIIFTLFSFLSLFSLFLMDIPQCYLGLKPVLCVLHSDVNSMYLSSTEPPAAAEWACLLRPLRGREPEGIWNLLSIVREMFKRRDSNAAPLLEILTEQCLTYEQVHRQHDTSSSC